MFFGTGPRACRSCSSGFNWTVEQSPRDRSETTAWCCIGRIHGLRHRDWDDRATIHTQLLCRNDSFVSITYSLQPYPPNYVGGSRPSHNYKNDSLRTFSVHHYWSRFACCVQVHCKKEFAKSFGGWKQRLLIECEGVIRNCGAKMPTSVLYSGTGSENVDDIVRNSDFDKAKILTRSTWRLLL